MGIQSSINTALGVAAIASGLTNKKQVDKAQNKLDKSEEKLANTKDKLANTEGKLANTEEDLVKTTAEKDEIIKQQAEEKYEQNIQRGGNTFNVSNDLPTAKETNIGNTAGNNSVNDINPSIASSLVDLLKNQEKINPYETQQMMGFHALKMKDSMVAAKRELRERSRRAMTDPRTMRALEAKKDETYSMKLDPQTMRALKDKEDGTYSFRDGRLVKENLKSGYQVSFFRPEITDENIQNILKNIGSKLGPAYLGLYEGSPEISYSFKDQDEAMKFAQAFNQYSIWDNKEGKEIRNDKYNESAKVDYNVALDNFTKAHKMGGNK